MSQFSNFDDFLNLLDGVVTNKEGQTMALCPAHGDRNPSLSIVEKDRKILLYCFAGCQVDAILKAIGEKNGINITKADLYLDGGEAVPKKRSGPRTKDTLKEVAVYDYIDANGKPYQVVRYEPKTFRQRRPDGKGEWIYNLEGIVPTLYHQGEVINAIRNGIPIVIVEGERDVDNLRTIGIMATCNPMGAKKWRDAYSESLRNADITIIPDKDAPGYQHAYQVAASCYGKAAKIRILELPKDFKDASDWLQAGHSRADLDNIIPQAKEYKPTQFEDILKRCRHWLYMDDTGPLEIVLGALAANKLPGDPVWLLQLGTPGSGKTEILNTIASVKDVHQVAILTEASLLSGTPRRESPNAKGGLLREMGEFGILQIKDFGSVLSLNRDSRGPILAALREVYDGSWTRYVGTEGGRTLSWKGKCGLIGGATPSIDGFYAVMSILGERFVYYRLPDSDDDSKKAEKALAHAGHEVEMRTELSTMVADFFNTLAISKPRALTVDEIKKFVNLSLFATRCRSPVERDVFSSREIQIIPGVESPTRMVKVLSQLLQGLEVIGVPRGRAWKLVEKTALDSMPALRQKVLLAMIDDTTGDDTITSELATRLGYPTSTVRRVLEDMTCYGLIARDSQGRGNPDLWNVTDWTRQTYEAATKILGFATLPEIREGGSSLNEKRVTNKNTSNNKKRISDKVGCGGRDDTSPYPTHACRCGCNEFWLRPSLPGKHDAEWLCVHCRPRPKDKAENILLIGRNNTILKQSKYDNS